MAISHEGSLHLTNARAGIRRPFSFWRKRMTALPATVRHKNPGAMALGAAARKFGATKATALKDGLGQGNTIATFPTSVDGASAQMFLLRTGKYYFGKPIAEAIKTWCGNNDTNGYLAQIESLTRFERNDYITASMLEDREQAIELCKAMAWHEAGREYPMTDAQWDEAHDQFMTVLRGGKAVVDTKTADLTLNRKLLDLARSHLGETEIQGARDNPFIVQCFADVGSKVRDDDTAWCAAFGGAMLKAAGCAYLPEVLEARKYLNYGHAIDEPEEGCIVIFWRVSPSSWEGHFAIVESWTTTTLTIIGGNQGATGAVSRVTVPRTGPKSQVLGYRRPVPAANPLGEVLTDESIQRKAVGGLGAVSAFFWSVWSYIEAAGHFVGEYVGILPHAASTASQAVSTGQSLAQSAGVPWPIQIGLFLTVCALVLGAVATYRRLRPNSGALTRPPYETDEAPITGDGELMDAFAALPPERSRRETSGTARKASKTGKAGKKEKAA